MDQWLDSLSEDWISQPRSDHSSSIIRSSVSRDSPSPNNNASQSRIPRYKPRAASALSAASEQNAPRQSSIRRSSARDAPLKEKTSSNLNASHRRQPNGQPKARDLNAASMRLRERQVSTGSIPQLPQDTVQYKSSPAKENHGYGTPEWKRRVLKENVGGDLFSPIGLEGVFKPPTVKSKVKGKSTPKRKGSTHQILASSPVPNPTLPRLKSVDVDTDPKKPTTDKLPPLSSPEEEAPSRFIEQPHVHAHVDNQTAANIRSTHLPEQETSAKSSGSNSPTSYLPPANEVHLPDSAKDNSSRLCGGEEQSRSFSDKTSNENISPFYVSRHNTVDGRVEYAAIDMSMQKLRAQMDRLRSQQQNIPSSRSSDHDVDYTESKRSEKSFLRGQMDEVTSQSLPDDLSMGTDAYAANGGFVSLRRGGYSNDGSFQRRPVSPSLLADLDGPSLRLPSSNDDERMPNPELPRHFSQTKSKTPSSQPPSSPPKTPNQHDSQDMSSWDRPRSSGSPLKLFDKYDTFTNEKLSRRMSKFEETLHNDWQEDSNADGANEPPSTPSPRKRRLRKVSEANSNDQAAVGRRINSFGDGELGSHPFLGIRNSESPSFEAHHHDDESLLRKAVKLRSQPTSSHRSERERFGDRKISKGSAQDLISDPKQLQESSLHREWPRREGSRGDDSLQEHGGQDAVRTVTGKRLPYSPAKDPASKRRRTLRNSEEMSLAHLSFQHHVDMKEIPSQSLLGKKRKDAIYGSDRQAADADTLATRQIRQPKAPNPSQTGLSTKAKHLTPLPLSDLKEEAVARTPKLDESEYPAIDPPTQIVAGALATVALHTAQEVTYGSRKASVTTADFFNEAQQIMQLIRARGRPRSSHATTEASEIGQPTIVEESVMEDSTKDEFSRPPSREGSPRGLREASRPDPRVVSHLRKFKDDQDLGLALSSSLKSLKISQSRRGSQTSASRPEQENSQSAGLDSDPPNIRIRDGVVGVHTRKGSDSVHNFSVALLEQQNISHGSQSSSGPPTDQSHPTGSSRSSTNRMVIAPETVAHLLSDQMAGMVFDRQKQLWVKRKSSPNVQSFEDHTHTGSEGSEEDLFGDIPDLTVNEMDELQRVKEAVSSVKSRGSTTKQIAIQDQAIFNPPEKNSLNSTEQAEDVRPRTAEDKTIPAVENSSVPSKYSHFASSGPHPGTRATSCGDAFPQTQLPRMPPSAMSKNVEVDHAEQVEHEISIFDGRESRTPKQIRGKYQARVVTVAFSSPLVDQRETTPEHDEDSGLDDRANEIDLDDSPSRYHSQMEFSARRPTSTGSIQNSGRRNASRRMSFSNHSYLARPMSRLDEEDEMSLIHCSIGKKRLSMEVAITTPLPMSRSLALPQSIDQRSSIGFRLSPLPDFTVHQIDKPIDGDSGQVTKRLPIREVDNRLSLAAQDLVKNLTDLEPYEPYWDYIRCVELPDRELGTLHMLDEFCGRVEELDVSNNQIRELDGIPNTVRQLNIRQNCLSDLTGWDSLRNLQYIDISHNQITSLRGFQHLFHLRSMKADNNEIESFHGIEDLNGLTSLSLRNNRVHHVDFEEFDL